MPSSACSSWPGQPIPKAYLVASSSFLRNDMGQAYNVLRPPGPLLCDILAAAERYSHPTAMNYCAAILTVQKMKSNYPFKNICPFS